MDPNYNGTPGFSGDEEVTTMLDPNTMGYNGTPGFSGDEEKTTMIDPASQNYYAGQAAPSQPGFNFAPTDNYTNQYQQPNQNAYMPNNQYQQPDMFQQQYQPTPVASVAPKANSSTKLIAIIVLLVIAAAVAATLLITGKGSTNYNGTYKCVELTYMGMTFDEDLIDSTGEAGILTIKGNKMDINGESGRIKIKGDKVTMTDDSGEYEGTYDKDTKTISITIEGYSFKFKKQ